MEQGFHLSAPLPFAHTSNTLVAQASGRQGLLNAISLQNLALYVSMLIL